MSTRRAGRRGQPTRTMSSSRLGLALAEIPNPAHHDPLLTPRLVRCRRWLRVMLRAQAYEEIAEKFRECYGGDIWGRASRP
jgi:hypothetical protein